MLLRNPIVCRIGVDCRITHRCSGLRQRHRYLAGDLVASSATNTPEESGIGILITPILYVPVFP
jgi:hypothetical protein